MSERPTSAIRWEILRSRYPLGEPREVLGVVSAPDRWAAEVAGMKAYGGAVVARSILAREAAAPAPKRRPWRRESNKPTPAAPLELPLGTRPGDYERARQVTRRPKTPTETPTGEETP